jgi:hypothetical protein
MGIGHRRLNGDYELNLAIAIILVDINVLRSNWNLRCGVQPSAFDKCRKSKHRLGFLQCL